MDLSLVGFRFNITLLQSAVAQAELPFPKRPGAPEDDSFRKVEIKNPAGCLVGSEETCGDNNPDPFCTSALPFPDEDDENFDERPNQELRLPEGGGVGGLVCPVPFASGKGEVVCG